MRWEDFARFLDPGPNPFVFLLFCCGSNSGSILSPLSDHFFRSLSYSLPPSRRQSPLLPLLSLSGREEYVVAQSRSEDLPYSPRLRFVGSLSQGREEREERGEGGGEEREEERWRSRSREEESRSRDLLGDLELSLALLEPSLFSVS